MKKTTKNQSTTSADKAKIRERAKIAKTVQQTIPYLAAYPCGVLQVAPTRFARAYALGDVNFTTADPDEQEELFESFCLALNALSEADVQICCMNRTVDIETFKKKHFLQFRNDGLDIYRNEVNEILVRNLDGGKSITNDKYLVLTINAENIDMAMQQFQRLDSTVVDVMNDVGGAEARALTMEEWLGVLYQVYNPHSDEVFHVNFDDLKAQGLTTKDAIAPESMQVKTNKMMLGETHAASLVLTKFPASLTTDFIADINNLPCHLVTGIHFTAIQQDKSVKMVRNQLTNINSNIVDQQKKAAQKGYSAGLISPDLESARNEAMDLLADITGKNQRLYYATMTITVYADDEEQLKELLKLVQSIGQKYVVRLNKMDYQQDNGLNTSAPMGLCDVHINSLLTTEAAALFIPFPSPVLWRWSLRRSTGCWAPRSARKRWFAT